MTDGQWLLLLFALLYFAECLRLVPAGAQLYAMVDLRGWLRGAFAPLDFGGRRLLVLPVLPRLPAHAVLMPWRLLPCEDGLEVLDEQGQPEALLAWADLRAVAHEAGLRLTEQQQIRYHHPDLALKAAEMLQKWAGMKQEARERDFEKRAAATLDETALAAHLAESSRMTRRLRAMSVLIFAVCFGLLPLVYRWFGDGAEVLWASGLLLLLMATQAMLFWRVAGRLPQKVSHRFWKTLAMLFLPQFGLRASDHIMEARPVEAHPLAAWLALPEAERLKLARRWWKAACYSSAASAALQRRVLHAFWRRQGLDESLLEEVPERQTGAAAFCPRCQAQFREAGALCQDCGGLSLKSF
jgi:hypothetical protein